MWIHKFVDPNCSPSESWPRLEAAFYRRLAENSLGLMCCHDLDGVLLWINPAAAESLGYSSTEGVGLRLESFLAPEVRPLFSIYLARIRSQGVDSGRMRLVSRSGERRIWMYRNTLSDDPALPPHVLGHALDITKLCDTEAKLRDLNAELEARIAERTAELKRSNEDLREFAYVASHDLQAPLKQVQAALELLETKAGASEAAELLRDTRQNIFRMSRLTDSLLRYALVSSAATAPAHEVTLCQAIEESLMNLKAAIATAAATVIYNDLPHVLVNEASFVQLFQNLIGNAIKYSGGRCPRICISAEVTETSLNCAVQDDGIGIDPAFSEKIFHAFSRLHGKEYDGTGIGLAICKKIVERMGGRIWVESEPGAGSTFRFVVPR